MKTLLCIACEIRTVASTKRLGTLFETMTLVTYLLVYKMVRLQKNRSDMCSQSHCVRMMHLPSRNLKSTVVTNGKPSTPDSVFE